MEEPAFDIYEAAGRLVLEIALPGVIEPDIDITIRETALIVQAERPALSARWVHREIRRGRLVREISLPARCEISAAVFEDGLLRLELRRLDG